MKTMIHFWATSYGGTTQGLPRVMFRATKGKKDPELKLFNVLLSAKTKIGIVRRFEQLRVIKDFLFLSLLFMTRRNSY